VLWANGDDVGSLEANFLALRLHRKLGDLRGEAGDVGNIAEVYRGMGDNQQALRWANEAIRIYRELGDRLGEAMRLATVAAIHRERGEPETALRLVLKTLQLYTELGVKNLLVAQHSACGTLCLGLGAPERALEHFSTAARLGCEIGYTRDEGYALMSVGAALEQLGDHSGAAEAYRRASQLLDRAYRESGMPGELSGKADALALLTKLLHRSLEQPEEALITYRVAADIYRELQDPDRLRKLLLGMAGLCWRTGRLEESARGYEEVLELAQARGEASHEAAALASLSVVYRDLDLLRESLRRGREARILLRDLGDLQAEAYVLKSLAESYGRCGHYSSALSCLRRSLRLRRRIGDEKGEIVVLYDLTKVYNSLGDVEAASASFEEAAQKERVLEASRTGPGAERRG
jgi:tetratricopeptide (TPR) repeat protein